MVLAVIQSTGWLLVSMMKHSRRDAVRIKVKQ